MPAPPLLLCDRVVGIQGEPLSIGRGRIWTETDIRPGDWFLHNGRMPAGIFMEAGQADLLLASWLGVDMLNQGKRAYRLLGCELVFHGSLPEFGETLQYQITADGFANHGDVMLFFFHYQCRIDGEVRISMTNGKAGFFTKAELDGSQGLVWNAENAGYASEARGEVPVVKCVKRSFSQTEIRQYQYGNLRACFGSKFEEWNKDSLLPTYLTGKHLCIDEILSLDTSGRAKGKRLFIRFLEDKSPSLVF